jgi:hypothetical protein
MLSCNEICKALSSFEGEQVFKLENYNPLFEQSSNFSKNYLQLVEDKIKENSWVDPNLEPIQFKEEKIKQNDNMNQMNNTQTENDTDKKQKLEYTFLNYKEHQTNNLPQEFLDLIDINRRSEIYYYGMKGPDSFLASVLLGAEPNYWLQHRNKKKEYSDQIRTTFSIQKYDILRGLSKESVGNDYLTTIYSNDFPENIDSDKSKEYQFLIGYHYKINALIIELKELKGYFVTDWNPDLPTLIILLDNQTYLPILSNKISYFKADEIKKLERKFNILYPTKLELKSNTMEDGKKKKKQRDDMIMNAEQIEIKTITLEQILPITKYQLKDLQDIAEKLKLTIESTKYGSDNKTFRIIKKTKKDLYDEITDKITSFNNSKNN